METDGCNSQRPCSVTHVHMNIFRFFFWMYNWHLPCIVISHCILYSVLQPVLLELVEGISSVVRKDEKGIQKLYPEILKGRDKFGDLSLD